MPLPLLPPTNDPKDPYDLYFRNQDINLDTPVILKRSVPTKVGAGPSETTPAPEIPLFVRQVAPDLVPSLANNGVQQTPPEQGQTIAFRDFTRGAGQEPFEEGKGRYAFGLTDTRWGVALPPRKATALTGATLTGTVKAWCTHEGVVWFAAGQKVYKILNHVITEPANQPGVAQNIVSIASFQTASVSGLFVFYGEAADYKYTGDNGTTAWSSPTGSGIKKGKFTWTSQSAATASDPSHPVMVMVRDPNTMYATEDPTDSDLWDTGAQIGLGGPGNPDHFTSVVVAPTGQLLAGKDIHWFRVYGNTNDVQMVYDPIQTDAGLGMENFAWPQLLGKELFAVCRDFDIIRYSNGQVDNGFGPGIGPKWNQVQELQEPIVALTSNGNDALYAALDGNDGYVMEGTYGETREWDWHGAVASVGFQIGFMFAAAHPLEDDRNLYLYVCREDSPYTIKEILVPKTSPEFDDDARFEDGWIRTGKIYADRPRDWKTLIKTLPVSRYLGASATLDLEYRLDQATAWTPLVTGINESPEPTNLNDFYAPLGIIGKSIEFRVKFNVGTPTSKPTLESLEPKVIVVTERADQLTAYVEAGTGVRNRRGGDVKLSLEETTDQLWDCMKARNPVLITSPDRQKLWTVRIRNIIRTVKVEGFDVALGNSTILQVEMIEIPSVSAINGPTLLTCEEHIHWMQTGAGNAGELEVELDHVPLVVPQVVVDQLHLQLDADGGAGFDWTEGESTLTIHESGTYWEIQAHYDPNA